MLLVTGEYNERLSAMILPLCPPVLQCCSEGHNVDHPAGRDPLCWMSERWRQEVKNKKGEMRKERVTVRATSPSCTDNRSINGY